MNRFALTVVVCGLLAHLNAALVSAQPGFSPRPERFPPTEPASPNQPAQSAPPQPTVNQPAQSAPPQPTVNQPAQSAPPQPTVNQPAQSAPPQPTVYQPAQVIARIGDQPIFLGELLGPVNQTLEAFVDKYPKEVIDAQREKMIQQLLKVQIENKILYLEFLNQFPQQEAIPQIIDNVHEQFNKDQLDKLIASAGMNNAAEFDAYLRRYGSSLQKTRRNFTEQVLGQEQLRQNVNFDPEVTHQEMLDYYWENIADYETPAEVRWQQMMVRYDRFPSKEDAFNEIRSMFNQVYFGGRPFSAVAKERSHGINADQGGVHDWTQRGSLAWRELEDAIFQYPEGRLSPILESKIGFHVVQVLERREASRITFKAPDHIAIVRQSVREDGTDFEILAELENSSNEDTTVELSLYFYDGGKQMRYRERTTVIVPRLGSTTATFELSDPGLKSTPNENIKLSIEPQIRIKQVIRKEKIEQEREEYLEKVRKIYKPWTIYDQQAAARPSSQPLQPAPRNAHHNYAPPGGSFRPQ